MMTPEEIAEATALCDEIRADRTYNPNESQDAWASVESLALSAFEVLPKALASLTEAYAEIAQVKDIHALIVEGTMEWCAACTTSWPCATLQVLWNHSLAEPRT